MICVAKSHFQQLSNGYQVDTKGMENTNVAPQDLNVPESGANPDMCIKELNPNTRNFLVMKCSKELGTAGFNLFLAESIFELNFIKN